jgi:hypothetical protein
VDPDPWIRIGFGRLAPDPEPGGQKNTPKQKKKKAKNFIDLMCWTWRFSDEGNFSYIQ